MRNSALLLPSSQRAVRRGASVQGVQFGVPEKGDGPQPPLADDFAAEFCSADAWGRGAGAAGEETVPRGRPGAHRSHPA